MTFSTDPTTVVNWTESACDVRIDRSGPWGNPFRIGPDGDRDEVCEKFERWLAEADDPRRFWILEHLEELRGKRLGCHCAPLRCHGQTYVRLLESSAVWAVQAVRDVLGEGRVLLDAERKRIIWQLANRTAAVEVVCPTYDPVRIALCLKWLMPSWKPGRLPMAYEFPQTSATSAARS